MFFKGKHEAARMELRFINKTGNRHFDKPSYISMKTRDYKWRIMIILNGIYNNQSEVCLETNNEQLSNYTSRVGCTVEVTNNDGDMMGM